MLSPKTLERVSCSYRKGYYDGYYGRPKEILNNGISKINDDAIGGTIRPFADFDYEQGYQAGANDARWAKA